MVKKNAMYQMDTNDYLPRIPDDSINLCISDFPYGMNFAKNQYYDDSPKYVRENIDFWFKELNRVLINGSHLFIYVPTRNIQVFINSISKYFRFDNVLVSRTKASSLCKKGTFKFDAQLILHATKGKGRPLNLVDIQRKSDAWIKDKRNKDKNEYTYHYSSFLEDRSNAEIKNHPNAKNVEQIKKLIILASDKGDSVIDPFAGGGSTALACIQTHRDYFTCDLVDYGVLPVIKPCRILDPCAGSGSFLSEIQRYVA